MPVARPGPPDSSQTCAGWISRSRRFASCSPIPTAQTRHPCSGTYGQPGFFLIFLTQVDWNELDRPGPSTFGLLVPDLDEAHARALAAGAIEAYSPRDAQGMPRHSAVKDPSGNWVTLFQG